MAKLKVRPGDGRVVRLVAGGKPVKAEGMLVERTLLIEKWLANGDLVVVRDTPAAPMAAVEKGAKS